MPYKPRIPAKRKEKEEEPTLECEACYLSKPVEDFLEMHSADHAMDASPQVCDHCRKFGPPMMDPCLGLEPKWRGVLLAIASGVSIRASARAAGMDDKTVRAVLNGTENHAVRASMQKLLIHEGLGPDTIARVIKEAVDADRPSWHPKEEDFTFFPDHSVRLRAIQPLIKLNALEAPAERAADASNTPIQIAVVTNLGSNDPITIEGQYQARSEKGV